MYYVTYYPTTIGISIPEIVGQNYRIKVHDSSHPVSVYGYSSYFNILGDPPQAPIVDVWTVDVYRQRLYWKSVPRATNYWVDITDSKGNYVDGFNNRYVEDVNWDNSVSLYFEPPSRCDYYWLSVRSENVFGVSPNYSQWLPILGESEDFPPPTALPAESISARSFSINWSSVPQATNYEIHLTAHIS